jgi:transposase-like protein
MNRKRRNHSATLEAKVALDALKSDKTIAEIADKYDLHANCPHYQICYTSIQRNHPDLHQSQQLPQSEGPLNIPE